MHLLKNLEHFLSSFLSSKEFYAALIGALSGGWIAGWFALRAQDKAALAQKARDRETEREAVNAILRAVKAELKTFHDKCLVKLDEMFEVRENSMDGRKPLDITPLKQNYFIVFDSNAAALGKIDDPKNPELLGNIVTTYSAARSLLDSINYNNELYQSWSPLVKGMDPLTDSLVNLANDIRTSVQKLQTCVTDLIAQIEKYLNS